MAIPAGGIADPTDRDALLAAFVQTYEGYDRDPGFIFETFQRYQEYAINNPDAGSTRVANALEVPRSMVRKWVDNNAVPYVAQGVQALERHGWDDLDWGDAQLDAFVRLVAWIFSSGSLHAEKFHPEFVVDDTSARRRLEAAAAEIGLSVVAIDSETERVRDVRGEVMVFSADSVTVGRLLAVLGAPLGRKRGREDLRLPRFLASAPQDSRLAFAQTYVANRARERNVATVTFGEARPDAYAQALVALLRNVTGEHVTRSGIDINVSKAAAKKLGLDPYSAELLE